MSVNIADLMAVLRMNDQMSGPLLQIGAALKGAGQAITEVTGAATAWGMSAIKAAGDFQQTEISFKTMLGSGREAQKFLKELADFAAATPFSFNDLTAASQKMLAMGFASKEIIPMLTSIGDASAGSADKIQRITLALGQMNMKGRVTGEEMRQLTEAGVKSWDYLATAMGKTTAQVQAMATKGLIDAAKGIPMILAGMNKDFGGMMAEQAQTITGKMSTIKDTFEFIARDVGTAFLPIATQMVAIVEAIVPYLQQMVKGFADADPMIKLVVASVLAFVAALGPALIAIGGLTMAWGMALPILTVLGGWLVAASPWILAVAIAAAALKFAWDEEIITAGALQVAWEDLKGAGEGLGEFLGLLSDGIRDNTAGFLDFKLAAENAGDFVDVLKLAFYGLYTAALDLTMGVTKAQQTLAILFGNDEMILQTEQTIKSIEAERIAFGAKIDSILDGTAKEAAAREAASKSAQAAAKEAATMAKEDARVKEMAEAAARKAAIAAGALTKEQQKETDAVAKLVKAYREKNTEAGKTAAMQKDLNVALAAMGPIAGLTIGQLMNLKSELGKYGEVGVAKAKELQAAWEKANFAITAGNVPLKKTDWQEQGMDLKGFLKLDELDNVIDPALGLWTRYADVVEQELQNADGAVEDHVETVSKMESVYKFFDDTLVILDAISQAFEMMGISAESGIGLAVAGMTDLAQAGKDGVESFAKFSSGDILGGISSGIKAIGGAVSGAKKLWNGLFGKAEVMEVNDMRDAFFKAQGGFEALQKRLAEVSDQDLVARIFKASTVAEFNAAVEAALGALDVNAEMMEKTQAAIDKYGITVDQLGEKWRNQKLDEQARSLFEEYRLLEGAGVSTANIAAAMGENFSKYVQDVIKSGGTIPIAMKPQIDAMIAAGELIDENGNAYTSAEQAGITYAQTMTGMFTTLIEKLDLFISKMLGIPSEVNSRVNVDYNDGSAPGPSNYPDRGQAAGFYMASLPRDMSFVAHKGEGVSITRASDSTGQGRSAPNGGIQVGTLVLQGAATDNPEKFAESFLRALRDNTGGVLSEIKYRVG